jgi:predicted metal-dependent phosphoesterase TrpH
MSTGPTRVIRADLHVHSYHSGYAAHLGFLRARDCYSDPATVYRTAKARGMDLVTITDHDSVDGCVEFMSRHPAVDDFFMSEEIECRFPDIDLKVHIGAYDIDERIHREIQPLRGNLFEAVAYLRAEGVLFALNHPFFFFKRQIPLEQYLKTVIDLFSAFEVRNGTMLPEHNVLATRLAHAQATSRAVPVIGLGGSDSHTLRGIGTTYTEVIAGNRAEFFQNLRAGHGCVAGCHGSAWREACEIYGVVLRYWASLLGVGPAVRLRQRRLLGLAFSAVSMPFEFAPLVVALLDKRAEARLVAEYAQEPTLRSPSTLTQHPNTSRARVLHQTDTAEPVA